MLSINDQFTHTTVTNYEIIAKHKWRWTILQLFDLVIFYEVYKSHQIEKKTDRLRWLHSMEATLEAAPQIILQIIYLLRNNEEDTQTIVLIGLILSILKLGITAVNADDIQVTRQAKSKLDLKFWIRFFFRFTEITSRVFVYVLIWITMGVFWLGIIILFHLINNI